MVVAAREPLPPALALGAGALALGLFGLAAWRAGRPREVPAASAPAAPPDPDAAPLAHALARAEQAEQRLATQEREVAQLVEDLERSNRELDDFAYVASHDLKAPLRAIESLTGFLVEDLGERIPPASREHLDLVRQRSQRMAKLLEDLLEFSRAGRMRHAPGPIDVRQLVDEVVALLELPPGFEVEAALDLPELWGPRVPLEQVLRNLIENAIKHHDRPKGRVEIGWSERGDRIELSVSDDGPGIPAEHQERVFRMFTTLRPRDEVEGSGMGLALIRKLVEAAGGQVQLESTGRGTTFRFDWPKRHPAPSGTGNGA